MTARRRSFAGSSLTEPLERIAVLRALRGLGDFLCAVPALRALRAANPEVHVTLIGLPSSAALVARFAHYVDELLPFPGFPGIPEVAVDPELFLPYPADAPEPLRHLALMAFLGFPCDDASLEVPLLSEDEAAWQDLAEVHALADGAYACVHPGAAEEDRRWPTERFAAAADALAARGLRIVLTGSAGERRITRRVATAMRAPAVDLAGETPLGLLAALLSHAAITVTNDTGTSHLATALGARSVVVFVASDPARWAPVDTERHRAVGTSQAGGAMDRCLREGCRLCGDAQVGEVGVDEVVAACEDLLAERRHEHAAAASVRTREQAWPGARAGKARADRSTSAATPRGAHAAPIEGGTRRG